MADRVMMAAQNNADWYAMMWDLRGLRYVRDVDGFRSIDPPPPYHGSVTAAPGAPVVAMVAPSRDQPGFAVKDGSGEHDLSDIGLVRMFDAQWLWHPPESAADVSDWVHITAPGALAQWEEAWRDSSPSDERQFPDAILAREDIGIWGRAHGDGFDAGVIANLSNDCVGLSNSFGAHAGPAATALCAAFGQWRPVVGYERGDALTEAVDSGWQSTGPLTVWVKPG